MKSKLSIPVKSNFSVDLYMAFNAACEEANVSHAQKIRDFATQWLARRNDRRQAPPIDRTGLVPNRAKHCPGRARFASRMSLRM